MKLEGSSCALSVLLPLPISTKIRILIVSNNKKEPPCEVGGSPRAKEKHLTLELERVCQLRRGGRSARVQRSTRARPLRHSRCSCHLLVPKTHLRAGTLPYGVGEIFSPFYTIFSPQTLKSRASHAPLEARA